jgi:anaerobic dimethyl sulfoxide reductase subunit B (iron-sulfur subunit)
VAAIVKQENGRVWIDAELCVACEVCVDVCPFSAIVIQSPVVESTACHSTASQAFASKCDGCADEIAVGRKPACVRACPMRALHYGAATSALWERRVQDREFEDHGIGPAVLYLR